MTTDEFTSHGDRIDAALLAHHRDFLSFFERRPVGQLDGGHVAHALFGRESLAWASFAILALILLPFPHALSRGFALHCPYL
jgi:hypothetical protein